MIDFFRLIMLKAPFSFPRLHWIRSIHLSKPSFTAGQTQYHGQKDSTWWDKYNSYVDPVQSREELLNMDELDERHFRPVKPVVPTYQSFSCFHDPIVSRVLGILLREGNRELVEDIMHKTFRTIKLIQVGKWQRAKSEEERASIECDPVVLLKQAVKNATPIVRKFRWPRVRPLPSRLSHVSLESPKEELSTRFPFRCHRRVEVLAPSGC